MKRLCVALGAVLLLLGGCGGPAAPAPQVPVGVVGLPFGAAPLYAGQDAARLRPLFTPRLQQGPDGAPFLVASVDQLKPLAEQGYRVIGVACARVPESLLWHGGGLFGWSATADRPLFTAAHADPGPLQVALGRYAEHRFHPPVPREGGTKSFEPASDGFLLAPWPLAGALVDRARAHLAQSLADELGPFPACVILGRTAVVQRDPLLTMALLATVNRGLWLLDTAAPASLLPLVRPGFPTQSPASLLHALEAARTQRIWAQSSYFTRDDIDRASVELGRGDLPPGALDNALARRALTRSALH